MPSVELRQAREAARPAAGREVVESSKRAGSLSSSAPEKSVVVLETIKFLYFCVLRQKMRVQPQGRRKKIFCVSYFSALSRHAMAVQGAFLQKGRHTTFLPS